MPDSSRIEETLVDVLGRLEGMPCPFALVGGLGVSVRGEVRFTRDIDIAVSTAVDSDTENIVGSLQPMYSIVALVEQESQKRLATARLIGHQGVIVDIIAATCGIEPELVSRAAPVHAFGRDIPVALAEDLLAMKVLSMTEDRPQDRIDAIGLLECNPELDLTLVRTTLALISQRGFDRRQDLVNKLEGLLAVVAHP